MPEIIPYDREAAVQYAHRWAYGRNPIIMTMRRSGETAPILPPNVSMPGRGS